MSDIVKPIRTKPSPPAAGRFGLLPPADRLELRAYTPSGCPSLEQFEARFLFGGESRTPPKAA